MHPMHCCWQDQIRPTTILKGVWHFKQVEKVYLLVLLMRKHSVASTKKLLQPCASLITSTKMTNCPNTHYSRFDPFITPYRCGSRSCALRALSQVAPRTSQDPAYPASSPSHPMFSMRAALVRRLPSVSHPATSVHLMRRAACT